MPQLARVTLHFGALNLCRSNCGAILEDIVPTGLTTEEIETRSFYRILQSRRKA